MAYELGVNWKTQLDIDTTPDAATPTWARISKGFSNISEALNEVIHQTAYLGDEGWGSSEVLGGQYTLTLTGDRCYGDAAQDYLFGDAVRMNWLNARKTKIKLTRQDGTVVTWGMTIATANEDGGDANGVNAVTVELHSNGKPEVAPVTP